MNLRSGLNPLVRSGERVSQPLYYTMGAAVSGDTINTTTADTAFASGAVAVPANLLRVGQVWEIVAAGRFSTKATGPGTQTINIKSGSTVIAATATSSQGTGDTDQGWILWSTLTVLSVGASASFMGNGNMFLAGRANRFVSDAGATFDSSAAWTLQLTNKYSVSDATNSITLQNFTVTLLNP